MELFFGHLQQILVCVSANYMVSSRGGVPRELLFIPRVECRSHQDAEWSRIRRLHVIPDIRPTYHVGIRVLDE